MYSLLTVKDIRTILQLMWMDLYAPGCCINLLLLITIMALTDPITCTSLLLAGTVAGKVAPKKVVPGGKSTVTAGKSVSGKKVEPAANGKGSAGDHALCTVFCNLMNLKAWK